MATDLQLKRALLCLEGLSLGDAFGETFFGSNPEGRIAAKELKIGMWPWSDDTAMALSIYETLVSCGHIDQDHLAICFANRYINEPLRGYGPAMHDLLRDIHYGRSWRQLSPALFSGRGSFGNGAAMRAPVIGAWLAEDLDEVAYQTYLSAEVTHNHKEAIAGAIAVAVATAIATTGSSCPQGPAFIEAVLKYIPNSEVRTRTRLGLTLGEDPDLNYVIKTLGNGSETSAVDTVPFVIWCASESLEDYEQALWLTVSGLGDRDTTCAMVGGIVASRVGLTGLPPTWLAHRESLHL